jgi:hypothetical protein
MADLNAYVENQNRMDTAEEMDENTQAIYRNDLMYLFFKVLLFFILGGVFYFLFKDQDPNTMVTQIKEKTELVTNAVRDKLTSLKPKEIVKE